MKTKYFNNRQCNMIHEINRLKYNKDEAFAAVINSKSRYEHYNQFQEVIEWWFNHDLNTECWDNIKNSKSDINRMKMIANEDILLNPQINENFIDGFDDNNNYVKLQGEDFIPRGIYEAKNLDGCYVEIKYKDVWFGIYMSEMEEIVNSK